MSTLNKIAQHFADKIRNSGTQREAEIILDEINGVVYENTNNPISPDDKEKIVQSVYDILQSYVIKQFDNKNYLELVRHMLAQIRASKK
jgi:hypothetical protein